MANISAIGRSDFLSHVRRVRSEVRDKFSRAHKVLLDRETDLLDKLQVLEDEFIGDVITKQIEQLNLSKDGLITTLTGNANKEVLEKCTAPINARILELEQRLQNVKDTYKRVALEWDVELEDKLSITGDILLNGVTQTQVRDYRKIEMPVATFGKHSEDESSSPGVFRYPGGLTVDPTTDYLYICDRGNNRVQVFNKSFEFIFMFTDKMDLPNGICVNQNNIYITQLKSNLLSVYYTDGKYLQSVGGNGENSLEFDRPCGLDISTEMNRIFIAELGNHRIHCLNLDLTFHSFIDDIFGANDVKLTPEEIVVLSCKSPCVFLYSYSNQPIRRMIPFGEDSQLKLPGRFVLDEYFNLFITDSHYHCICVYSFKGELLHKFGREGDQKGEFIQSGYITICPQGRIIVTSDNPNHCIQVF